MFPRKAKNIKVPKRCPHCKSKTFKVLTDQGGQPATVESKAICGGCGWLADHIKYNDDPSTADPKQAEPKNSNCLDNMRCPKCRSLEPFEIGVNCSVSHYDNGAEETHSNLDWDIDSYCKCEHCGFEGTVYDFKIKQEKPRPARLDADEILTFIFDLCYADADDEGKLVLNENKELDSWHLSEIPQAFYRGDGSTWEALKAWRERLARCGKPIRHWRE